MFVVVLCAKLKSCRKEKDALLRKNLVLKGKVEKMENENKKLTEERDECLATNEELEAENLRLKEEIEKLKKTGKA